jgi:hypothetical protein
MSLHEDPVSSSAQRTVAFAFEQTNSLGVEPNADNEEERPAVCLPYGNGAYIAEEKCPHNHIGRRRQLELSRKDVTCSQGKDAERNRMSHETLSSVVNRPVASCRDNRIEAPA